MGNGASSNIRSINIQREEGESDDESREQDSKPGRPFSSVSAFNRKEKGRRKEVEIQDLKLQVDHLKVSLTEESEKAKVSQDQVKSLEEQVASLESGRLDLEEHIEILEEKLEEMHAKAVTATLAEEKYTLSDETIRANDPHIKELEQQLKTLQDDIHKLKAKHKIRVKKLNASISETRHEMSLHIFEMKNEMDTLTDENCTLKEKLQSSDVNKEDEDNNMPHSFFLTERSNSNLGNNDESRNRIILELSSRVSEQEEEINRLKTRLVQKEEEVNKNDTEISSAVLNRFKRSENDHQYESAHNKQYSESNGLGQEIMSDSYNTEISTQKQSSLHPQPPPSSKKSNTSFTARQRNLKFTTHRIKGESPKTDVHELMSESNSPDEMMSKETEVGKNNVPSSKVKKKERVISRSPDSDQTFRNSVLTPDKVSSKLSTGWLDEEEDSLLYPASLPICSH